MSNFLDALALRNNSTPPIWFMRQAGRYHSHYQKLRKQHSFVDVCKKPEVACLAALGPIQDFDFDAAILFSDLLFPLEAMGMGLEYSPGPKLSGLLTSAKDLKCLKGGASISNFLQFQSEAVNVTRQKLPKEKALLGFVGGPITLFSYAVSGSHKGDLSDVLKGLKDGRFEAFCKLLLDPLSQTVKDQAMAGCDAIMVIDTAAGSFSPLDFRNHVLPALSHFINLCTAKSKTPLCYYSKGASWEHWKVLENLRISYLGVDWSTAMTKVLSKYSNKWALQGNFDPAQLLLPTNDFETLLEKYIDKLLKIPKNNRRGWVAGLGHGVLPTTPENHVKIFISEIRKAF